ncbi:MAG: hypothetical protein KDD11_23965, partial [Acidobacteria bacterium]|nr:hypothetical protein [Acidobacteriota bacterium]
GALGRAAEQTARRSESIEPTAGREAGRGASGSARSFVTSPPAGDMLVRIDGGPVICRSMKKRPFYEAPPATVTVRAFVVAGKAPAELVDRDGDGVIDLRDARRSGLRLLSSEAVFSFEVYFQGFSVLDLPNHFYSDLDGNGQVGVPPGTEAGPAQLTDPPR